MYLFLVTLLSAVISCIARPDGAPLSACSSLMPVHSAIRAQDGNPPYTVSAEKVGNKVRVKIYSPIGEEFQGFVLQARSSSDRKKFIPGEFTNSHVSKAIDCFRQIKNTLTQVNTSPKKEVVTEWTPSSDVNEDVIFRATVAKTFAIFYTEIDSNPAIKIRSDGNSMGTTEKNSNSHSIYDACFTSKGCFGLPSGCAERSDCEVLLTYADVPGGIRFTMHGFLDQSKYMAMALSMDERMGDDSVTECIRERSNDVIARTSWNEGQSNTRTEEFPRNRYSSSFSNGLTTCDWTRPYLLEQNGRRYDLANTNYHLLLATGPVADGALRYHQYRIGSSNPQNLTAYEAIESGQVTSSVKIHGIYDENTEIQYTPPMFTDESTDEREAKSTTEESENVTLNGSSQLSFNFFLLAIFGLFCIS